MPKRRDGISLAAATPRAPRPDTMNTRLLSVPLAASLLLLPACVAAIGNSASGVPSLPRSTEPLLAEKVQAAERIVTLREQKLDQLRAQAEGGRVSEDQVLDAQIALQEAKIRQLQLRAELAALRARQGDDD